ncbi:10202_t:CDS:2 [Diversispora eburnea]|uniref:10202_t:CDS:1 n=1 Tax=Diversispora eburnea TaxID=1213867 RepID=A0A9N9G5R7_9GLOM|nr:10202_t:CDS:2 [Diversispora eburnea]
MANEEPGIKISYNTNMKEQPMPSSDCSTYFEAKSEDNFETYGYDLAYLPKGQISMNTSEGQWVTFTIRINDDTYDFLNQNYPYQNKNHPKLIDSIEAENKYYITQSSDLNVYVLRYYRQRREELKTIEFPYTNDTLDVYAMVYIILKTPSIEIEREQKARTILEVLANIAALYGLAFGIYALLFGVRVSKPLLAKFMPVPTENPSPDGLKV